MEPDNWTGLRGKSARKSGISVVGLGAAGVIVVVAGLMLWAAFRTPGGPQKSSESSDAPAIVSSLPPTEPTLRPEARVIPEASVAPPTAPITAPPTPQSPASRPLLADFEAKLVELRRDPAAADSLRKTLGRAVLDEGYPLSNRRGWLEELAGLTKRLVFSAAPMTGSVTVRVLAGDNLTKIAERVRKDHGANVTPDFIRIVNDLPPNLIRVGTSVKVPVESLAIVIDKSEFRIYLTLGGAVIRDWPIGIGKDERTPEGLYKTGKKSRDPTWTDPESGKTYKFGEPGHLIGTRWIAFDDAKGRTGFGIHGTIDPDSIGKAMSAGCIRMLTPDIEALFDLVPAGIEITIRA